MKHLLAALLLCAALPAHAVLPAPVAKALHDAAIPEQNVAVYVRETGTAKSLLDHLSSQPLSPASTMKLVTTYAALELLGPIHTWQTGLYAESTPQNGVLEGDIYLKGSGDPALTIERFWLLLRDLRLSGVRELRGNLVLDDSRFVVPASDPGAFDNAPLRPYNVLPDALLVNFKSTRFRLLPADNGKGVRILADPAPPQLALDNRLRLVEGECGDWREGIEAGATRNGGTVNVSFSGDYPLACGEKTWHLSLIDNPTYVGSLFRMLWEEVGGVLSGATKRGVTPPAARLLASAESRPLADIVRDINKFSNNVMARQLLLTLGNGKTDTGAQAINTWLAEKGLRFPELVVDNGSGLSRRERISAEHLGELLMAAWRSPMMAEFVSSLPIAGIDGTMKKRLVERGVASHAHIKTGSLRGVKAIAGYVHDRKGRNIAVVFLINHPNAAAGQAAQDALLEWIYQRS